MSTSVGPTNSARFTYTLLRLGLLALFFGLPVMAYSDAGVLIPHDKQAPDESILSLAEMRVDIRIDNDDARIRIVQIFANHTDHIEEGSYIFALPDRSTVSDFAVWDGPVRIPAVILERRRAEDVYDKALQQAIDPGLLEMGEHAGSSKEHPASSNTLTFSARIVPIPARGTKRLELEYHQRLSVNDWKQFFSLPLKPDAYHQQHAERLTIHFEIYAEHKLQELQLTSHLYPMTLAAANTPTSFDSTKSSVAPGTHLTGSYEGTAVSFDEDFGASWQDTAAVDSLHILTYRNPVAAQLSPDEKAAEKNSQPEHGFFEAEAFIGDGRVTSPASTATGSDGQTIVLLFDNSLSMQWDKLERSYAALEAILRSLHQTDHFNLILFNQDTNLFEPTPVTADSAAIQKALNFVRSSKLRGGTDIGKAMSAGLKQCTVEHCALVMMTDGGSDRGESVLPGKIAATYQKQWKLMAHPPKTNVFAVGDDADLTLLKMLAQNDGVMEHVLSSEPIQYKLDSFLSKIARSPVAGLNLTASPAVKLDMVYPLDDAVYTRSAAVWVGQYNEPAKKVTFEAKGVRDSGPFSIQSTVDLPGESLDHPQLPRLWAEARVNALLEQIARDGETRQAVDEIIRLARKYKLVTPYTSFLAAPRALLRPRVIRPGDPVLRVHTDPAIRSVIALFPFGLTKPLHHLSVEDTSGESGSELWETRFLAPQEMKDGAYPVRLIMRDDQGNSYREEKTFVIASTPPVVKIVLDRSQMHKGETLQIKARASTSTRTLTARLEGVSPVSLRWNSAMGLNTGAMTLPSDIPTGRYILTVTAEDIAHNMGGSEVPIEILP